MDHAVLDVSNLMWRAFHGYGQRDPVLTLVNFVTTIPTLCEEVECESVAFALDHPPYKRRSVLPTYKIHREKLPSDESDAEDELRAYLRKMPDYLRLLGYKNVFAQPGYEADDVMASCARCLPVGDRAVLVSGDGDLYQLLSRDVCVYHPRKPPRWVTASSFRAEYGIPPRQWTEVKCVAGCAGDGVDGLDGVAVKTACKFFRGQLAGTPTGDKILAFNRTPQYVTNRKLVALPYPGTADVEIRFDAPYPPDGWRPLAERLGVPIEHYSDRARRARAILDQC